MFHDVPYTDFHELNLDFLLREFRKYGGLKLAVQGDKLVMLNDKDEVVSSVTISYATKALTDKNGKDITAYIYTVAGVGDTVVFTHGDGTTTSITVPYAEKAKYDLTGHELEDYIYNVQVAGDKLRITHGDGTIADITVPYAIKASTDDSDKPIDTYAASLTVENDNVVLRDSKGRLLNSITVPYAVKAQKDDDGDIIKATYGVTLDTGTTTVILKNKAGTALSTITVPYATEAHHADEADHATLATDATNAIETVTVSGDQIVFTTYGGVATSITAPYAIKAQKDDLGNTIKTTYVANVTQDSGSGVLTFWDAMGTEICHLTPIAGVALRDNYGNDIADFIKSIVVSQNSDYVTVTHGTGTTDTLTIHYSETAWKDTNGNVIKNFYISYLECIEDVDDGHYKIVAYNGDTPRAELFRFEVTAYSAQTDINGKDLTSYVADVSYNAGQEIEVKDGEGNLLNTLRNAIDDLSDVEINNLLATGDLLGYDGTDWTNVTFEVALDDLTDVTIDANTLANGDVLTYDANANEWVNKPAGASFQMMGITIGTYRKDNDYFSGNAMLITSFDPNQGCTYDTSCLNDAGLYYITQGGNADQYAHVLLPSDIKYYSTIGGSSYAMPYDKVPKCIWDGISNQANGHMDVYYPIDFEDAYIIVSADVVNGVWGTFTATKVTSGGGSGLPSNPHCIVGDFANGGGSFVYTAGNAASIVSGAQYGQKLAITLNNTDILYCAGVTVRDENTSTYIFDKDAVQVIEEAGAGTLTTPTSIKALFYTKFNGNFVVLEVEIVLANNTIVANGGNVA